MKDLALSLEGVHTFIGAYHILHGIDLQVPRGQVTILLGRNGAGKTTTLRTIMGLWRVAEGQIHLNGTDIGKLSTPEISRLGVAYVPESMGIFSDLTVRENILLAARSARNDRQISEERLAWIYGLFPPVKSFWHKPAGKLSGGQKQMVAIARAMIEPRDFYLIDEPSKGLAPSIVNNVIDALTELKRHGATILLVEQNVSFAQKLGDHVAVMDNGKIVHASSMGEFASDTSLQQQFLGLTL